MSTGDSQSWARARKRDVAGSRERDNDFVWHTWSLISADRALTVYGQQWLRGHGWSGPAGIAILAEWRPRTHAVDRNEERAPRCCGVGT